MMKKVIFIAVAVVMCCFRGQAQTDLNVSDLGVPSLVSPYYFGPNAFPIPDMLEGGTSRDLRIEAGVDYFHGIQKDRTADAYLKVNIQLFSERVNLTAWKPVLEWWRSSVERQQTCRLDDKAVMSDCESGDVYVSTDIWVLQAERFKVDLSVRAAMKTASGNGFATARYYDSPAYFFDASISKPFLWPGGFIEEFRITGSGGFLCWQTDNGRQNDAVMYGLGLNLRARNLTIRESFGGYFGWEGSAANDKSVRAGDCPMSLKTDLVWRLNRLEILFRYQVGLYDWPFHQFRFGVAYNIGILK